MTRRDEILAIFKGDILTIVTPLIDDMLFLEKKIAELEEGDRNGTMPFIRVNPNDPGQTKLSPAYRVHKEYGARYDNIVRILCSQVNKAGSEVDISPLRKYYVNKEKRE